MSAVQPCVKFVHPTNSSVHDYVNYKMSCDNLIVPKGRDSSDKCNGFVHQDSVSSKGHTNHVSFLHTYKVLYLGYAVLDRRYTLPMLPWVIAEIKRHGVQNAEDVFLEVTEFCLKAINNKSNKLVFEHKLTAISKFAQTAQDPKYFTYMTREVVNGPCAYHVFQADAECIVLELFTMLREMSKEMIQHQSMISPLVSSNSSIAPDCIMSSGQHYEVLYLGRIKVSSKRAPPSFIDDAVEKFRVYELEKMRSQQNSSSSSNLDSTGSRQRHGSGTSISSLPHSLDTIPQVNENQLSSQVNASVPSSLSREHLAHNSGDSSSENSQCGSLDEIHEGRKRSASSDVFQFPSVNSLNGLNNFLKSPTLSVSSTFSHEDNLLSPLLSAKNNVMPNSSLIPSTQSLDTSSSTNIVEDLQSIHLADILRGRVRSCSGDIPRASKQLSLPAYRTRVGSGGSSDMRRPRALTSPASTSSVPHQRNRTMLFLIGRLEICLIGMDKKQVLLNKTFNDIAHCSQGVKYLDHFGFICRETTMAGADCYAGYIFRCQTEQVVDEIMQSLKLAFKKAHQDYQHDGPQKVPNVPRVSICEGCPMQWFHRLCSDVDGLPPEKSHCTILLKLHTLPDNDREDLMQKCDTVDVNSLQEQNEVLMMLLREFCEQKQIKHIHINNGNHQKTDYAFMKEKSTTSKLDNLRQKAKKSLSSSFETFRKLKHRDDSRERSLTSISDHSISALRQTKSEAIEEVVYREGSYDGPSSSRVNEQSPIRPRSSTFSTTREVRKASQRRTAEKKKDSPQSKSPIMNIFMKVGHSDKTPTSSGDEAESASKKGSWRQAIFHRVQTPVQTPKRVAGISRVNTSSSDEEEKVYTKKSREQLRALWKKAILEQILLIRMEKENKKLQVSQDAVSHKRMKLDYEDITPCLKDVAQKWENLLNCSENSDFYIKKDNLLELVKTGVPRNKRGDIWQFLAEQYNAWGPPAHLVSDIDAATPYEELIGQLTSHQHAILIDLGRTFPSHPFYCQPLGPGQLSLFNLLKAYSLLDKEVGYCQGLSFVAGILLLHIPEERAFSMMKHILFCLGLRRQYKPDMVALQIQMYQLSRLMHDNHREVYDHLEKYDIAPTLYAAPWFLTLYASQFPMGFVSRLFDILFLQGLDTIFKVALVLIGNHKDRILQCHGFEAIMEFLKVTLPSMNPIEMERVFSQVFTLDIHKQLHAYEVEYHVLREEMIYSPSRTDTEVVQKLEAVNRNLKVQNMELMEQLQVAYSTIDHLESSETSYKSTIQRLEARVNSLEDEKEALLHSMSIMKKRLQLLETACLATDDEDDTSAILDSHHPPSFRVVYDLAGTEKEEEKQLKSLIRNFCKDQGELAKDNCNSSTVVENSVQKLESSHYQKEEFPRNGTEVFIESNNSHPDLGSSLIHHGSKHQIRLNIEKERMKHNL